MALILLVIVGVLAGWFASVLARIEDRRVIRWQIAIALVMSLVVGLLVNRGTFLGGLDWIPLGAALAACSLALGAFHLYRRRGAAASAE